MDKNWRTLIFSLSSENSSLKRERSQLTQERDDLFGLAERRQAEVDRLQKEWQTLSDQLIEANNAKCQALVKVGNSYYKLAIW